MVLYDVTIVAVCPENKRPLWEKKKFDGYDVTFNDEEVCLIGHAKTQEELKKLDHLVWSFPDHHIRLKKITEESASSPV